MMATSRDQDPNKSSEQGGYLAPMQEYGSQLQVPDNAHATSTEMERSHRKKNLTGGGEELYEATVETSTAKLIKLRKRVEDTIEEFNSAKHQRDLVIKLKDQLGVVYDKYLDEAKGFMKYLTCINTSASNSEKVSQEMIHIKIYRKVTDVHNEMVEILKQPETDIEENKEQKQEVKKNSQTKSHSSVSSSTTSSRRSSLLARQRAKLEAAKTSLTFTRQEVEMQKQQAKMEAEVLQQRAQYESDLQYLKSQRAAAVAQAELEAMYEELGEGDIDRGPQLSLPSMDRKELTAQFINEQGQTESHGAPRVENNTLAPINTGQDSVFEGGDQYMSLPLMEKKSDRTVNDSRQQMDPNAPSFYPERLGYSDFTKYLLRKDLLLQRLTTFDDKPETFSMWKASFQSVTKELGVTANEEFDLLFKWLGPESKKHALSIRASNPNPARGLERLWERLHERYGCPEMVEASLKRKLEKFPKLGSKDNAKLYELADILSEVEAMMEDPIYGSLLGYYNTSSGVLPIVGKLPLHIQGKWTVRAARYKKEKGVAFPPFSEFVVFIKEMSSMLNDPGLVYKDTSTTRTSNETHSKDRVRSNIQVNKTQVSSNENSNKQPKKQCLIHNTSNHDINQCRAFRLKSLSERRRILSEHRLCFSML